jgi:hypothetical protein
VDIGELIRATANVSTTADRHPCYDCGEMIGTAPTLLCSWCHRLVCHTCHSRVVENHLGGNCLRRVGASHRTD